MKKFLLSAMFVSVLSACTTTADKSANTDTRALTNNDVNAAALFNDNTTTSSLTDPNSILSQRSVYFDFDSFIVKPEYRDMLNAHAKYLAKQQKTSIVIQGNTDNRGTAEYNLALGQKRAVAVKNTLNLMGIPDSRIETVSFGKERPKDMESNAAAWAKNRRADIVYAGEKH